MLYFTQEYGTICAKSEEKLAVLGSIPKRKWDEIRAKEKRLRKLATSAEGSQDEDNEISHLVSQWRSGNS
jgi:hypothetical protein